MSGGGDRNKKVLASELVERLMGRFRGEIQDLLGDLNKISTHFVIQPDEKVCTGIDRLNGTIQNSFSEEILLQTKPS